MRLPVSKVYRAFRVLDAFTDAQCEGYVRRAMRKHMPSMFAVAILAVPVVLSIALAGFIGVYQIGARLERGGWLGGSSVTVPLALLGFSGVVLVALIVGLLMRDAWLRWAIGMELRRSTCPGCEYQLLGLKAAAGVVRCPECGMESRTDLLQLSEADLNMVKEPSHPPVAL